MSPRTPDQTPIPIGPLSASQVASVEVMTALPHGQVPGHSASRDLLIGYALRPFQKVQKKRSD